MTNEQREAIEYLERQIRVCNENAEICGENNFDEEATYLREESYMLDTVLSLIKEQQEKIAKYEKIYKEYDCYRWGKELDKKDKIIDLMAEFIATLDIEEDICANIENDNCDKMAFGECENCIKQYFADKVEKEN